MKPFRLLALAFCCLSLLACQPEETPGPAAQMSGVVVATQAYLDNFGEPPQGKAGQAFARVGYLPVLNVPGKVRAFPLFLFNEDDEVRQILNRLTGGELEFPENSRFYNPFPGDLQVMSALSENSTLTMSLMTQQPWPEDDMASAGLSLAATALQFEQTSRVVIMLNDQPLPQMPEGGYVHNPEALLEVAPPALVLITGTWEKATDTLEELLIEFDRPVKVNSFKLYNSSDQPVEGEYFTSIFQMAVVILPEQASLYKEGDLLRAKWAVIDDKGRANSGTDRMALRRYEH